MFSLASSLTSWKKHFGLTGSPRGLVGLTFHDDDLRLACVSRVGGLPRLTLCQVLPMEGVVPLEKTLKEFVRANGLKNAPCVGILAGDEYQLVQAEMPDVPPDEAKQALRWQMKEMVNFPIEDALIDLFPQPPRGSAAPSKTVNVVIAHRGKILKYMDIADAAGLELLAVDIQELAVRNVLGLLPECGEGLAFLYITHSQSQLIVVRGEWLYLSRTISIGRKQIERAIVMDAGRDVHELDSNLRRILDSMVLEIQRSLDYYESYFRQDAISAFYVSALEKPVPGILSYLSQALGMSHIRFLSLDGLLGEPRVKAHRSCGLSTIGGALREGRF